MDLSNLTTTTTVEFNPAFSKDTVTINGVCESDEESRVVRHLERIRSLAKIHHKAKVVSINNFPIATGLSSSSSGFAALTVAGAEAAGLKLSEKELSILARQGSGSACRSIPDGFVEWLDGTTSETSYAVSLFPPDYWDIFDVVAIVSEEKKDVSSTEGHKAAQSSPLFEARLTHIKEKISLIKKLMKERNFTAMGELIEQEALEFHSIILTSTPSQIYWTPETLKVMKLIRKWRKFGMPVYFTMNTGQDIHLICEKATVPKLQSELKEVKEVKKIVVNTPSVGTRIVSTHLF
jgi:diphosphomevalonate decarboxylase